MSNKKQSSIEWLIDYIKNLEQYDYITIQELEAKAKAMHKKEMDKVAGDWWNEGASYMHDGGRKYKNFEEYYKETFEE